MTTSAPRLFTTSAFDALAVVATLAPRCFASWMAMVPTPPAPAWMRTFWPGRRSARSTSACQAVNPTRGMDAASAMVSVAGLLATSSWWIAMNSANVPIRFWSGCA